MSPEPDPKPSEFTGDHRIIPPLSRSRNLASSSRTTILFLILITAAWLAHIWFYSDAAWLHPELLGTAAYIWNNPDTDTLRSLLGKSFDWKAFDPNVNRVRPLNDVVEVVDAIARPFFANWFGPHPSAMPSSLLTVILAPTLLYVWFKRTLGAVLPAMIFTLLFVSSTGFLSDVVAYIRPAKKLNLVFLCLSIFLALRFADRRNKATFTALYLSLLASFFSDELGLANFVIIGVMHWKDLFVHSTARYRWAFLSLPAVFLLLTKFAVPAIYQAWSVHGAWDALADPKKFAVFAYLLSPEFYQVSLQALARSLMSTVAIGVHTPLTESLTLAVFGLATGVRGVQVFRRDGWLGLCEDRFLLASVVLAGTSTYATLLDWYPFPHRVSYLGSFNYYYHSSVVISTLMWFACGCALVLPTVKRTGLIRWPISPLVVVAASLLITANFILFQRVNQLVQIIHLYPYNNGILWASLRQAHDSALKYPDQPVIVKLAGNADNEAIRFRESLHLVFGDRWNENYFHRVMGFVAPNPIMSPAHVGHFYRATIPWSEVILHLEQHGRSGWTAQSARLSEGPPQDIAWQLSPSERSLQSYPETRLTPSENRAATSGR